FLSPEFNSAAAYRAKVKTPFELVASILRVMDAEPDTTQRGVQIVARLGQPIFGRLTPDGWPDQGSAWMNAGALMNRVNLGVQVGSNQFPGVSLQRWAPTRSLTTLGDDARVQGVIDALLAGDASAETRHALSAIRAPAPSTPPAMARHIGEL